MLKSVNTLDELKEAVTTNNIAVVDLYATWCKPCQEMQIGRASCRERV